MCGAISKDVDRRTDRPRQRRDHHQIELFSTELVADRLRLHVSFGCEVGIALEEVIDEAEGEWVVPLIVVRLTVTHQADLLRRRPHHRLGHFDGSGNLRYVRSELK